ncbi:hypothetical protein F2Q69_00006590 [Brassica cretica]|uniref:Uncharacterized protein n=1 Tax=Brassica cretica TaxID=69181 RepID=A0A8S9NS46_BRACR|nr:hypothetical protein F2Q69_00006590 [Brassica cretica]
MSSLKKRDKIQKKREVGKPESSFVTTPKRIHTISSRKVTPGHGQTDPEQRKQPSSNLLKGRVGQNALSNSPNGRFGSSKPSNSPFRRVGSSKSSNSLIRRVGPNEQSNCHLDRSHCWNFTI